MSLTASPTRAGASSAVRLDVTSLPGRFLLVGSGTPVEIDARPSLRSALAWERSVRRIDVVEFCRCGGSWAARVSVVGHRLPARRDVPLSTAIGLALRGHRLSLCPEAHEFGIEGEDRGRLSL